MSTDKELTVKYGAFEKRFSLTAEQKEIINKEDPLVHVSGPPGTGKTTVLMCKGLKWLEDGNDVTVFGLHLSSLPTSRLIYHQLSEARDRSQGPLFPKDRTWGFVKHEHAIVVDQPSLEQALTTLHKPGQRQLYVIMDNISPEEPAHAALQLAFVKELRDRVPDLHLWASDWFSQVPDGFAVHILTQPLRYGTKLLPEIGVAVEVLKQADILPASHVFSFSPSAPPGPDVIHTRHKGAGLEEKWPIDSGKCGRKVAKILRKIGVGTQGSSKSKGGRGGGADSYQFRDVLVISRNAVDKDRPPSFLRGLEASGVPAKVFASGNFTSLQEAVDDIILAKEDKVTVMNFAAATGLDRKVVVCLTGALEPAEHWQLTEEEERDIREGGDLTLTLTQQVAPGVQRTVTLTSQPTGAQRMEETTRREQKLKTEMEMRHRLSVWTRCCHQLVVVHLPKGVEGGPSGSDDYGSARKCVVL